ncbi:kinase-like protein [Gigaspora margarita]|uniref:Kinase-like protein n=1 Tax=Gigaspora margarita TaxID=4874 RepID=A0A8H4AZ45_GIGMA|nr:kinase-like protein [Gigaspora margarita]
MKRCWHQDPNQRPKATELSNILSGWIAAIYDYPTSTISIQLNAINRVKSQQRLSSQKFIHPQAKYTSQLFGFPSLCDDAECNDDNLRPNRSRAFTI